LPTAIVNGGRINFVQLCEGTGERMDLVMVHGLAANMAFWYFKYACELAKSFRVTVFDLRGHGRSEMTRSGYSPESLAHDMTVLLDQLGIGKAHLLAHSFGGVVAMRFALKHPERVRSLVLADTHIAAARHFVDAREWAYGNTVQALLDAHGFRLDTRDPYFGYRLLTQVARMQLVGMAVPPELLDLVSPLTGNAGSRTAAQWVKLMDSTDAEAELMSDDGLSLELLCALKFPIMAMYGDRSPARLTGTELLQVWPHAMFRNVRNAGHFFPSSRTLEVIRACRRFWGIGASQLHPHARAGEEPRGHFRSDRIFQDKLGWYFTMRELPRVGPFAAYEEAESILRHAILNNICAAN
jgi:pimeloyl-ACP methyl ester carboxylesterase